MPRVFKRAATQSVVTQAMLKAVANGSAGGAVGIHAPRDFSPLGLPVQIQRGLRELVKSGELIAMTRGLYVAPMKGRFGDHAPPTRELLRALEEHQGVVIVPSGAAEANALGLSTQVPVREVFLTSGRGCLLKCGRRPIELLHARKWLLQSGGQGSAIRVLYWAGQEQASALAKALCEKLPASDWEDLEGGIAALRDAPTWLARAIVGVHSAPEAARKFRL